MICLFGGTFDPVHLGHLRAAERVCDVLGLDTIRLVLSARPSHKETTGASLKHRWAMLCLACEAHARLEPDDREMRRASPSYTVDTLEELRGAQPDETLAWVVGSDAYALLPSWYQWRRVLEIASLVVLLRPGHPLVLEGEMAELTDARRVDSLAVCRGGGILFVENELVEVAAETIRELLAAGADASHLLPAPVANYINEHGLYGRP